MWKCVASRVHPGRPGRGTGPVALSPAWGRGHAALISDKQLLGKRGARHSWSGHFSGCAFSSGLGTCGSIPLRSPLEVFLRNSFGLWKAKQSHSGWGVGNLSLLLLCSTITCISTSISSTMGSLEYLSQFLPGCVGCVTPSSLFFLSLLGGKTNCSSRANNPFLRASQSLNLGTDLSHTPEAPWMNQSSLRH